MTTLHPQLANDCSLLGHFPLCQLLLMEDANYPWFILVPDRDDTSEIFQLSEADQRLLIRESSQLGKVIASAFRADKINMAALGNVVPQLHVHLVVRYKNDVAWPAPVWGKMGAKPYTDSGRAAVIEIFRKAIGEGNGFTFAGSA